MLVDSVVDEEILVLSLSATAQVTRRYEHINFIKIIINRNVPSVMC